MQYSRNTNSVLRPSLSPWIAESTLGSGLFKNFLFFSIEINLHLSIQVLMELLNVFDILIVDKFLHEKRLN